MSEPDAGLLGLILPPTPCSQSRTSHHIWIAPHIFTSIPEFYEAKDEVELNAFKYTFIAQTLSNIVHIPFQVAGYMKSKGLLVKITYIVD